MKMALRWVKFSQKKFISLLILWLMIFGVGGYAPIMSGKTAKVFFEDLKAEGAEAPNFLIKAIYFLLDKWNFYMILSGVIILIGLFFASYTKKSLKDPMLSKGKMALLGFARIITLAPLSGIAMLLNVDEAGQFDKNVNNYINNLQNDTFEKAPHIEPKKYDCSESTQKQIDAVTRSLNTYWAAEEALKQGKKVVLVDGNKSKFINNIAPYPEKNRKILIIGLVSGIILFSAFIIFPFNILGLGLIGSGFAGYKGSSFYEKAFRKASTQIKTGTSVEEVKYIMQNMPLYNQGYNSQGSYCLMYSNKKRKNDDYEGLTFIFRDGRLVDTETSYKRTTTTTYYY